MIQAKMNWREELRKELLAVEEELIEAGAILAVTVASAGLLRHRGRSINGDSCRARILQLLTDGNEWNGRDIVRRIPLKPTSIQTQLSRMAAEGDIVRVRNGWYQQRSLQTPALVAGGGR